MELCNLELPYETDGKSFISLINDKEIEWENTAYSYFRNGISLRTNRYRLTKYFRNETPIIELYDHYSDSIESKNIATEFPQIVNQLMPLLEQRNTGLYE